MKSSDSNLTQIQRIQYYESLFDSLTEMVNQNENVIYEKPFQDGFKRLVDYYQSELWISDFEDDHNGLAPKNLIRGILSEDGIYNFLVSVNREIFDLIDNTNSDNS